MVDKILKLMSDNFNITEESAKEYAFMKVGPMKFNIRKFDIEGIGKMSIMCAKGLAGLMQMNTIIITSNKVDAPLFSYDAMKVFGNNKLYLEMYSTKLNEEINTLGFEKLIEEYKDLESFDVKANWYDDIKYKTCMYKIGKKKVKDKMDELTYKYFSEFINVIKELPSVDEETKKEKNRVYADGLLKNGGPSTDVFVKNIGLDKTKDLFYTVLFNVE